MSKVKFKAKDKYVINIQEIELQNDLLETINLVTGVPKDDIVKTVGPLRLEFIEIDLPENFIEDLEVSVLDGLLNSFVDIRMNGNKPFLHIGENYILQSWKDKNYPLDWE